MKLIKSSFEIVDQEPGLTGICRQIEKAGRNCYKSEDKITETSAKPFVDMLIKKGHGAMLEHGTVYLDIPENVEYVMRGDYENNSHSWVTPVTLNRDWENYSDHFKYCITTNYRVLVENEWLDDLQFLCKPTDYHQKRITVKFICDRGVSHELVRHRAFSFAQESTRYCNYSKDKFGNEITFIKPDWLQNVDIDADGKFNFEDFLKKGSPEPECYFIGSLLSAECNYLSLLEAGILPQQARQVLPNALKTELWMTGFVSDWKRFFELRCDQAAHPDMRELTIPLRDEFIKRGYIGEH